MKQRARLASAIAVPNTTFLARHCWSPLSVVTRLKSMIPDFVWGVRDGKRSRPWVFSEVASLPIHQEGLAVPCIQIELMTMAATDVGQWAATASSIDLLIGGCLWGSTGSSPPYITPCWNDDKNLRYRLTLWQTGSEVVRLRRLEMCAKATSRKSVEGSSHLRHKLRSYIIPTAVLQLMFGG